MDFVISALESLLGLILIGIWFCPVSGSGFQVNFPATVWINQGKTVIFELQLRARFPVLSDALREPTETQGALSGLIAAFVKNAEIVRVVAAPFPEGHNMVDTQPALDRGEWICYV